MFEKIPAPVKGQPARASWGAGLTNRVNELGAMFPSRGLARDGLTGTGFAALPANRRDRRTSKLPGRFEISVVADPPPEEGEKQTYTATFKNPYYDIGGKTYEMPADEEADPPGTISLGGIEDGAIIFLKISAGELLDATISWTSGIQYLQEIQSDVAFYTIPLYKIVGGSVACDFRTGPVSAMGEF